MPHFIAPYLHIDEILPTNLERGATPITGITTDFDGDLRNVTTPDIGADEFDGFTFEDPLPAGTYTVGTGGNFETIQHCFDVLSQYGVAGNVTLELIDDLYTAPTGQYGFLLDGPIPGAGPNSRVTIRPAENKNVTIEGNGEGVLYFLKTSYVTLDGVGITGPTTITVHNLVISPFQYNDAISFIGNCDHNVVQNTIALTEDITRPSSGLSEYERCFTPAAIHAMCEDYRAAASIDLEHDRTDADRRIECPLHVLWGERGVVHRLFTPVADWSARARGPVSGRTTPGGHYIPEESPELLASEMLAFFCA